ncbi:hypothetical protein GEV33_010690 [Tenebrio molitor]|uniref:Uncharacterized protein n=1 Tax=Tenebrio molitor TaxID=7067 RepID=A0A8J6HCU9_TENMO|nr:hypothetical protein GEV33_010690 [Tenebrio molitor]
MDVCVCLLGAGGSLTVGWRKEESTLFRPPPRGQHGFESGREGRPWVYKCCLLCMSVNVRWNGRGWPGKVARSLVAPPEERIGKGIGIEKTAYRKKDQPTPAITIDVLRPPETKIPGLAAIASRRGKSAAIANVTNDEEGMPKSPKARKESSKREREEGRMSEEGLNPFRKSSRTERSPSRGEERNQSKEIEQKIETVLREIKEDMAGIVEESRARRKELAAAREKDGEQEREDMLKSSEVRKESSKREREEGRTSKEGKNPLRNSSRTRRSPNRSQEENQSKEIDKEMKTTMIREMSEEIKTLRKELAAVREENGELRKELATVREEMRGREEKGQLEKADWMKRMEMIEEKMEQREKKERKNNVIITGIGAISGNVERGVEEWLEREIGVKVNVKEAYKINKDKMMLAKIENWEQKKNIMLSKSKLKEKKGERMYIDDDLTKEERGTQKKLRELAREERDRGKRVKIGYRKIQINRDWFRWNKRQEKLKKIC